MLNVVAYLLTIEYFLRIVASNVSDVSHFSRSDKGPLLITEGFFKENNSNAENKFRDLISVFFFFSFLFLSYSISLRSFLDV